MPRTAAVRDGWRSYAVASTSPPVVPASGSVRAVDPVPSELRAAIQRRLRERRVHGLAICAFDVDHVRFAGGEGFADLERGEPVTPTTIFRVASISKLLTTTLVLELADAGLVDLDTPVNDVLPPRLRIADEHGAPATSSLRTLLSHSSGLPAGVRGARLDVPVIDRLLPTRDLAWAVEGLRLTHRPETKVVYSNPGFNLAGHVAALTLGQSFENAVRERVLAPVGMADSRFDAERHGPGVATHYGSVLPPRVGPQPVTGLRLVATPMGGMTTNVVDLARFGQMVLRDGVVGTRSVLRSDTLRTATTLRATNHPDLSQGYGLGFRVRTWNGRRVVGHDGNMPGVASQIVLSPDDGVGVVVLTNGYALQVPHEVADDTLRFMVDPGHGSEPSTDIADRDAWVSLGRRTEGTYSLPDAAPPGALGRVDAALTRPKVVHEAAGRLRVEGNPGSDGPVWLVPDGRVGHYRVAAPVDDGTDAVIEERADGTHIWWGPLTHLYRRTGASTSTDRSSS